jgi:hypothetical protein
MADRVEQTAVTTDQKLEATDQRGLTQLNKAFDDAFGPREGEPPPAEPPPKDKTGKTAKTSQDAPETLERAKPGHHRPVEIKPSEKAPQEAERPLNLLGEPDYQARKRDRKPIEFDEEIPTEKKTSAFPGRDGKTGKFTKAQTQAPVEAPDTEAESEGEPDEADPEVDAITAKPSAHPDVKRGIQTLKTIAKARRAEIKSLLAQSKALSGELETIKATGMPPEVQQELNRLRATSQRFDLLNDAGFQARYENPIEQAGDRLLNFCIELAQGDEGIKKWAIETKKFGYKNLSPDYWDKEIIPKIASEVNQHRVGQLAANLHEKIDERNRMVAEFTSSPDKITEYNLQRAHDYYVNYANEAQDESNKLVAQIGPWAQLQDAAQANTDEERGLINEHNQRVEGYKTLFEKTMGDVMHGGPRKHVRVVAQAVYGIEVDRLYKEKCADYDELEADYEALKQQYNRVTRARSLPGRTGGGVEVKQPAGLSTKDARTALREYFGGSGS